MFFASLVGKHWFSFEKPNVLEFCPAAIDPMDSDGFLYDSYASTVFFGIPWDSLKKSYELLGDSYGILYNANGFLQSSYGFYKMNMDS